MRNDKPRGRALLQYGGIQANISSIQPTAMVANPISEIGDGQPQAASSQSIETMTSETMVPVVQIGDGQIQNPQTAATPATAAFESTSQPLTSSNDAVATSETIPLSLRSATPTPSPRALANSSTTDTTSSSDDVDFVACQRQGTLNVTLTNGVLMDSRGATGYIASNYQFQFDDPPQAGAIYTAGFSMCSNGSLALGGSAIFYACRSGNFSNLYDRWIAPQCYPVYIRSVNLITC